MTHTVTELKHFWGARAIAQRLGYRNEKSFLLAWKQGRAPAFRRRDPKNSRRVLWYSNENLILLGEFIMVQQQHDQWRADREEKQRANAGR